MVVRHKVSFLVQTGLCVDIWRDRPGSGFGLRAFRTKNWARVFQNLGPYYRTEVFEKNYYTRPEKCFESGRASPNFQARRGLGSGPTHL
jgi:hypothetical protein